MALTVCWKFWLNRNASFNEGTCLRPQALVIAAFKLVADSLTAFVIPALPTHESNPSWSPSQHGFIKVNYDVFFDTSRSKACLGVVARDYSGAVVFCGTKTFYGLSYPLQGELRKSCLLCSFHVGWIFLMSTSKVIV